MHPPIGKAGQFIALGTSTKGVPSQFALLGNLRRKASRGRRHLFLIVTLVTIVTLWNPIGSASLVIGLAESGDNGDGNFGPFLDRDQSPTRSGFTLTKGHFDPYRP